MGSPPPVGAQPSAFPGSGARAVPWGLLEPLPASAHSSTSSLARNRAPSLALSRKKGSAMSCSPSVFQFPQIIRLAETTVAVVFSGHFQDQVSPPPPPPCSVAGVSTGEGSCQWDDVSDGQAFPPWYLAWLPSPLQNWGFHSLFGSQAHCTILDWFT